MYDSVPNQAALLIRLLVIVNLPYFWGRFPRR
jgi:hypothetical protein